MFCPKNYVWGIFPTQFLSKNTKDKVFISPARHKKSNTGHKFGSFLARCFIFTPGGRLGILSTTIKSNLENMYPKGAFGRPRGQGLGPRGVNPYLSSDQSHIHTRQTSWDSMDDYQVKFGKYVP